MEFCGKSNIKMKLDGFEGNQRVKFMSNEQNKI